MNGNIIKKIMLASSAMLLAGGVVFSNKQDTDFILKDGDIQNTNNASVSELESDMDYKFKFNVENKPLSPFLSMVGGSGSDNLYGMVSTNDSGYLAVGLTWSNDQDIQGYAKGSQDGLIVKLDSNGKKEWVRTIGGSIDEALTKVTTSTDGDGYVITGYSNSRDGDFANFPVYANGGSGGIFAKYDNDGNRLILKKIYPINPDTEGMLLFSVKPLSDGGYVLAGHEGPGSPTDVNENFDATLIKVDREGNTIWHKKYGGSKAELFESAKESLDGNIIAVGRAYSYDGDITSDMYKGHNDAQIVKYNQNGEIIWKASFGGSDDDSFRDLTMTPDGGCIAVGYSKSVDGDLVGVRGTSNSMDAIIVKYNQHGKVVWKKVVGGAQTDYLLGIEPSVDGDYVMTGFSASTDGDFAGLNHGAEDAMILKIRDNGNSYTDVWTRTFGGSGAERLRGIVTLPDGGYAIAGNSNSTNGVFAGTGKGGDDAMVVKFNQDGAMDYANHDETVDSIEYKINLITDEGVQPYMEGSFERETVRMNTTVGKEVLFRVPRIFGLQEIEIVSRIIDPQDNNKLNNEMVIKMPVKEVNATIPTLTLSSNITTPTNASVTISAVADDYFGIAYIELPDGSRIVGNTVTYNVTENGTYTFVAHSNTGMIKIASILVSNIDKNAPDINIIKNPDVEWSNTDVNVSVSVEDR